MINPVYPIFKSFATNIRNAKAVPIISFLKLGIVKQRTIINIQRLMTELDCIRGIELWKNMVGGVLSLN